MNTAYGMLVAIAALLAIGPLQMSPSDPDPNDPPPPENCKCKVVNKALFYPGEIPKCTDPTGDEVDAFTVSVATYPQGQLPKPGVCTAGACITQTGKGCTYATLNVTVTMSPCAASLWGYGEGEHIKVVGDRSIPQPWTAPLPTFEHDEPSLVWSCTPPDAQNSNACGTREMTATMKALKHDGTTAFTVVFSFGCGNCKAASV